MRVLIQLGGMPLQQSNVWPSDRIERVILQQMQKSPIAYSYQSMEELSFELTLRKYIIESARAMYQGGSSFASFATSRCNSRYWHLTDAGGFRLKRDVKPSDALRDIFKNSSLYAFECATAIMIIFYHAVLNSMDEALFNSIFRTIYLYSWHSDSGIGVHNIKTRHFLPGDVAYIENPDFNPDTPWWRGENVVVLDDGMYFGHGIGIGNAEQMILALNQTRKHGSHQSAYFLDFVTRPSFKQVMNTVNLLRGYITQEIQYPIIHHNESSISYGRYLYYLYKFCNQNLHS